MNREENINRQRELEAEIKLLRKEIEKVDYEKNLAKSKKFVGKYYIEVQNEHHQKSKRVFYVWGVDKKSTGLDTIECHYHEGQDDYFGIEDRSYFSPVPDPDEDAILRREYKEITEEEFIIHYKEVLKRINKVIQVAETNSEHWISINDAKKPKGGINILVFIPKEQIKQAYYNASFNSYHTRSTMPNEQEDKQIYPLYWMEMPNEPL